MQRTSFQIQKRRRKDNIIKDVRNLFRLKKNINNNAIKLKEQNEAIKGRIIRVVSKFSEQEKEDHYEPGRVGDLWSNNYNEYESNEGRNKTLSIEE